MSTRVFTTANGRRINMDSIIAQNEESIAIGNMKVNARGDELGPGGKIERTKDQVMQDYYKLNTPVATDRVPTPRQPVVKDLSDDWIEPVVAESIKDDTIEEPKLEKKPLRGSLANSIANSASPENPPPAKTGPTRI